MSFDGLVTHAMVHELNASIINGRITKIYQPSEFECLFHVRSQRKNISLLLSAHPVYARFHLTRSPIDHPKEPPMFCMLLRKHLEGGIIRSIHQSELERVVTIDIQSKNELGDLMDYQLVIEIMGRHSNLILTHHSSQKIIDAIRRIPPSVSQHRQILPGLTLQAPPEQNKRNPLTVTKDTFIGSIQFNQGKLDKQLVAQYEGLGPLICKEIIESARLQTKDTLWEHFHAYMEKSIHHDYSPSLLTNANKEMFYLWHLPTVGDTKASFSSMSECLDAFYFGKAERDRIRQQSSDVIRKLQNEIQKNNRKIDVLEQELTDAEKAEKYRIQGELLTTYMHQIQKGDSEITLINYYDPEGTEITIPLNPTLGPSENSQRYFKKYTKQKESRKWNEEQITKAKEDITYLESVLYQLHQASVRDMGAIREELEEQGWLKPQAKKKKARKEEALPTLIHASDGSEIFVGRNNKQNDRLTHQLAHASDTWLHTKDIPGSHVVIRGKEPAHETLIEAAMLAAYFSKARESSQVPVDYTLKKHVKKPNGSRPGFVIYDHQQTLFVTPDEEKIRQLLVKTDSK